MKMADSEEITQGLEGWNKEKDGWEERKPEFTSDAGIPVKDLYTPLDTENIDYVRDIGFPGQPPYTRGVYPTMYRGRHWTIRMFSGHGTPEETNDRWRMLYDEGETGFSAAVDSLTFSGVDPDQEVHGAAHEVGKEGVPLYSIRGVEALVDNLPIEKMSVALVVEPMTSAAITSMYFNVARERGMRKEQLAGTTQNDILTMTIGYIPWGSLKPADLLKLACDLIEYCTAMGEAPRWNPINFTTYNYREGGIDAVQEIGMGLANAVAHIEELLRRGWKIDDFVHRLAFHLSAHRDFFEEIAKYRAARKLWYRLMKERYHPENPDAYRFRFHVQTAGCSLTAQQPMVNIVRTAYQALEAVLGGTQSLHTNSYDEAICLPSEESVRLAVRTQELIQEETGVTSVVDPLAGSYYVEALTRELEERIWDYFMRIEEMGGVVEALNTGWLFNEMSKAFNKRRRDQESGDERIIGVNCYVMEDEEATPPFRTNPRAAEVEKDRLADLRRERDESKVAALLNQLREVCEKRENVLPVVSELTAAGATLGEITGVYREIWGIWQLPFVA
ncbi:MAG: methylmalonyl-CoA mutase [Actinobacteria bacterium]|jgi:methylmalonyl-CoA mutase N-terminal domain/subunit|nr:MAG: methylmalonyl-CoA mutase [Actinomycetota bacterium]